MVNYDEVLLPIEVYLAEGVLDIYLADLESFEEIPAYMFHYMLEHDPASVEELITFLTHTMKELEKLNPKGLKQYNLSGLYQTFDNYTLVVNGEYDPSTPIPDQMYELSLDELRKAGELAHFLDDCANYPLLDMTQVLMMLQLGQRTELQRVYQFLDHSVNQLEQLTAFEKKGYDFDNIYFAHSIFHDILGVETNVNVPIGKKAENVVQLFGKD